MEECTELHIVFKGTNCPYPIDIEGIYDDLDIAFHVAEMCGGSVKTAYLNEHTEHLKLGKWVFNTCVCLSTKEIVFCKPSHSLMDGGENIIGHTQYSPDKDRFYAYIWAKDTKEAGEVIAKEIEKYVKV